MVTNAELIDTGKRVASEFSEKNVTFMAAGLAYHAFLSLAPMLLLLFLVLTTLGAGLETQIVRLANMWLPGPIANVVTELFQGDPNGASASLIGIVVLVWGTLKIFRGLDTAFSQIYETPGTVSLLDKFRDGVIVLVALTVALVAMVVSAVVLGTLADRLPFTQWLTPIALIVGLVVAFYPIYYVFPDADLSVRDVLPGVVVAAVGWAALQGLFQLYLSLADPSSGSLFGGVIVVVTYLYFSALVLLAGAVINAVIGGHARRAIDPLAQTDSDFEIRRNEQLTMPELAAYLSDLRSALLTERGRYVRTELVDDLPKPQGDITLLERSTTGESNEWTVTVHWTFSDEELTADDTAADEPVRRQSTDTA